MAFGVLMTDLTPSYQVDLGSYLFGNILAIPSSDLFWMVGIDCFILLLVLGGYKPLLAVSCDHEYAELTSVPANWFYPLVLVLFACDSYSIGWCHFGIGSANYSTERAR